MTTAFCDFMDEWNAILNITTPAHHRHIMNFLVGVLMRPPHRGLLMAFRHSGKSTVVGIFAACVLCMHPEYRILILSAESTLASRMVVHIRNILENHPRCADMIPTGRRTWACDRIIINRPVGIREPSVICAGIAGNITGSRADLIICDDVEVPNTCNTAQKREKLRERLRELEFILSPTGTMIYIGTPHTTDTIYRTSDGG